MGGGKKRCEKAKNKKKIKKKNQRSGGLGREKGGRFIPLPCKATASDRSKSLLENTLRLIFLLSR